MSARPISKTYAGDLELQLAAIRKWQPSVKALLDWDESAACRRAETTLDSKRLPLTGWSVAVKDIIDVEGTATRCGAAFIPAESAPRNAFVVDALLTAGAFLMAKAVTTTFAYFDPGPTRNPWNLNHTPGGSSSGSAAAVACGMVRLAVGTQTVASVNRPASYCGVVGFKPTYGRFCVDGVFPVSPSVDTIGFFTANVADAQFAWAAVCDEQAVGTSAALRIGVIEDMRCEPADPPMIECVHAVGEALERSGHQVQSIRLPDHLREAYEHHWRLVAAETAESHRDLFEKFGHAYTPKLRQLIERGRQVVSTQLRQVATHRAETVSEMNRLFDAHDLLLTPSAPGAAPVGIDATGDPRMSLIATYVGFPTLTLPARLTRTGLPLGVQLIGARMQDRELLAAGLEIEQRINFRTGVGE